jgi:hypothetical protein
MAVSVQNLTSIDETVFNETWKKFFYSGEDVCKLLKESAADIQAVLSAGERWEGLGWNTTTAAKTLRALTGVALVTSQFREYLSSFLYSIALVAGVDVAYLELSPKAADAAFVLAEVWNNDLQDAGPLRAETTDAGARAAEEDDDEEDEEQVGHLPWEEPPVPLCQELLACASKVKAGEKMKASLMLDKIPVFTGLKTRAEDNNHGGDGRMAGDKWLKALQQRLLNMGRVQAALYGAVAATPGAGVLAQQAFYYTLETEQLVLKERKRRSMPQSVAETSNALFTTEDLKASSQQWRINQAGVLLPGKITSWRCFPNPTGNKAFRFKGSKGRAWQPRGYGSPSLQRLWKPKLPRAHKRSLQRQRQSKSVAQAGAQTQVQCPLFPQCITKVLDSCPVHLCNKINRQPFYKEF